MDDLVEADRKYLWNGIDLSVQQMLRDPYPLGFHQVTSELSSRSDSAPGLITGLSAAPEI